MKSKNRVPARYDTRRSTIPKRLSNPVIPPAPALVIGDDVLAKLDKLMDAKRARFMEIYGAVIEEFAYQGGLETVFVDAGSIPVPVTVHPAEIDTKESVEHEEAREWEASRGRFLTADRTTLVSMLNNLQSTKKSLDEMTDRLDSMSVDIDAAICKLQILLED